MRRLNLTTTAFVILMMAMFTSPAYANWTQTNVTMSVGETKTLYLPSSITSLNLKSVNFYSASISYVTVESSTSYSVKVKAIKATSSPIVVRCDYYYYSGSYLLSGAHDFLITVTGNGSGSGGGGGNPDITSLSLSPTGTVELKKGQSYTFNASYTPTTATPNLQWWASDPNPEIISVSPSSNGKSCVVTALATGWTWINVGSENVNNNYVYHKYCKIVITADATGISVYPSSTTLDIGGKVSVTANLTPNDATSTVSWSSMNSNVAKVSGNGKTAIITAVGPGTTNILAATDNGCYAYCKVTVNEVKPTSISIPSSLELAIGEVSTLTHTLQPAGAVATVTWMSAKPSVATVNNNGAVTGVAPGEATVIASTDNGLTAFCNVRVTQAGNPLDVDNDGTVTAADITVIYNFLLKADTSQISTSDVDGDGTVTAADITLIYNSLLGPNGAK